MCNNIGKVLEVHGKGECSEEALKDAGVVDKVKGGASYACGIVGRKVGFYR